MVRGISKKDQRADLWRKRDRAAAGLALGAKSPPKARSVAPIGRGDKSRKLEGAGLPSPEQIELVLDCVKANAAAVKHHLGEQYLREHR
jgi:hypothetical protein